MYVCVGMYVCIYVCTYVCVCTCVCMYVYVCMYACMYVCMYVCINVLRVLPSFACKQKNTYLGSVEVVLLAITASTVARYLNNIIIHFIWVTLPFAFLFFFSFSKILSL